MNYQELIEEARAARELTPVAPAMAGAHVFRAI